MTDTRGHRHTQRVDTLCSWCDAPATHNLDTATDQCCDQHHQQWFVRLDELASALERLAETEPLRALDAQYGAEWERDVSW